jgi:hypothetical protein
MAAQPASVPPKGLTAAADDDDVNESGLVVAVVAGVVVFSAAAEVLGPKEWSCVEVVP